MSFLPGMAGPLIAARVSYTTWNSADKGSLVALSGGDLVATVSGSGSGGVRSIRSVSAGKWYWEDTVTTLGSGVGIGIATSSASLTHYIGYDTAGWGYFNDGGVYSNTSLIISLSTFTAGDIIGVAFDAGTGALYFRKNGTWQNSADPADGTGAAVTGLTSGPYFAAVSDSSTGSDTVVHTTNFGASAFSAAAPTGFSGLTA